MFEKIAQATKPQQVKENKLIEPPKTTKKRIEVDADKEAIKATELSESTAEPIRQYESMYKALYISKEVEKWVLREKHLKEVSEMQSVLLDEIDSLRKKNKELTKIIQDRA